VAAFPAPNNLTLWSGVVGSRDCGPLSNDSGGGSSDDAACACLEAVDLDGLAIEAQAVFLIGQEILDIFALIALQLDHLSHLRVGDDGAIAGELLLDHLEDLLLVEFLGQALDRGQGFATIALCEGLTSAAHDRRAVNMTRSEGATSKCHTTEE
jgi:hypothetical protein